MRLRPFNSVFFVLVCWALVSSIPVNAQEEKTQAEIEAAAKESPRNEPDPLLSESDSRTVNKSIASPVLTKETQRDSAQVKSIKPLKSSEKVQKEEDPLSFNFLYYIIEKFKLSDIIE